MADYVRVLQATREAPQRRSDRAALDALRASLRALAAKGHPVAGEVGLP